MYVTLRQEISDREGKIIENFLHTEFKVLKKGLYGAYGNRKGI